MEKRGPCALTSRIKKNICPTSKRAQVTIFIIIAIVIVALGVTAYFLFPKIQSAIGKGVTNPEEFIQTCLEEEIEDAVELVSLHGGDIEPTFFSTFNNIKIKNLCYTAQYCTLCSVQEPQLKPHIEREIENEIEPKAEVCFEALKESYENKGYVVDLDVGLVPVEVELLPQRVVTTLDYSLTLTKEGVEDTERYDSFNVVVNKNLYELISIANSILGFETSLGGADVTMYMDLYSHIKVEQKLLGDGTKIYIITDRETEDKFQFASRSLVLSPAGYC